MEKYYVYFGSAAGSWVFCDNILNALKKRDSLSSRTNTSVKDWHVIQYYSGYWFDII